VPKKFKLYCVDAFGLVQDVADEKKEHVMSIYAHSPMLSRVSYRLLHPGLPRMYSGENRGNVIHDRSLASGASILGA
jgi:hypothetical protein